MGDRKNDRFSVLKLSLNETTAQTSSNKKNENNGNIFKKTESDSNSRFSSLISDIKNSNINNDKNRNNTNNNKPENQEQIEYLEKNKQTVYDNKKENSFLKNNVAEPTNNENKNEEEFPELPWENQETYLIRLKIKEDNEAKSILFQNNGDNNFDDNGFNWTTLCKSKSTHCVPYNENCSICVENDYFTKKNIEDRRAEYRYTINKFKRDIEIQKQRENNERFEKYVQNNRERLMNTFEYDYVWSEEEKREYVDGYCYYCEKHNKSYINDDDSAHEQEEIEDFTVQNKIYNDDK
jgi:hypothetical protein